MASIDWAKTTARRDEKHLSFGICGALYKRLGGLISPQIPMDITWMDGCTVISRGTRFSTVPVIPGRSEPCWRPTPNPVLFDTEPKHHFMSRGAWKSKRSVMMYINPMSARRRCSNYVLDLTPGFNGLGKGGKTRRETFKFLDLVPLIYLYFGLYTLLHGFFTGNHTIALVPVKCPRRVWEHLPLSNEYKT